MRHIIRVVGLVVCFAVSQVSVGVTFFYTGAPLGDFVDETNWNDASDGTGTPPVAGTIDPSVDIIDDLIIDGDSVVSPDIDFGQGGVGSLTVNGGGQLEIIGTATDTSGNLSSDLDIDSDGALTVDNATVISNDSMFLGGTINTTGGMVNSVDDMDFQGSANVSISGTSFVGGDVIDFLGSTGTIDGGATFTATNDVNFIGGGFAGSIGDATFNGGDDIDFEGFSGSIGAATFSSDDNISFETFSGTVDGATFLPSNRIGLNTPTVNVVMSNATVTINGGTGDGDIEDINSALAGDEAGTLTLLGASVITMDDLRDGADLVLGGSSSATIGVDGGVDGDGTYVGEAGDSGVGSTVSLISLDATLSVTAITIGLGDDPRDFIINGLNGATYNQDPLSWSIQNWNGEDAVTLQLIRVPEPGVLALLLVGVVSSLGGGRRRQHRGNS